jgi:hypothetical protein
MKSFKMNTCRKMRRGTPREQATAGLSNAKKAVAITGLFAVNLPRKGYPQDALFAVNKVGGRPEVFALRLGSHVGRDKGSL